MYMLILFGIVYICSTLQQIYGEEVGIHAWRQRGGYMINLGDEQECYAISVLAVVGVVGGV